MSTKLINKSEVKSAIKLKGIIGEGVAALAMWMVGINKINNLYQQICQFQGIEFAKELLDYLNIKCNLDLSELDNLPKDEPFIIVSNHPFGAVDGIMLLSMISKRRPDIKILTNFMLSKIPNLSDYFLPVNPFTDKPGLRSSLKGLKLAKEHLNTGGCLALFPSGEVSSNKNKEKVVKDIEWQESVIKLIRNANLPVVPVYFDGGNSKFFHLIGKIHPLLRTIRLPHELTNKKDKTITLEIGTPILPSEFEDYSSNKELGEYLWNRTYALEGNLYKSIPDNAKGENDYTIPLAEKIEKASLSQEINKNSKDLLFDIGQYSCYLFNYENIPLLMQEIGRSREEAFRAVGEGTNKASDTDDFDSYYKHLVLWDKESQEIVGAYRLGIADEIIAQKGIEGLYTNTLFKYSPEFKGKLKKSIELGRSFISVKYQKEAIPLMLLIKGLLYSVIKYKNVKYLIGPVSISSWYPLFYRSLMIDYLREKQSVREFKKYIKPNIPFVPDYKRVNYNKLLLRKTDSLEKFDRFIYKLSNSQFRLPTLLKKYLKINARIIDFNVDPDFNYCVDGLIMLNLTEVPKNEIDILTKEFTDKEEIYKRFDISID